MSWKACRLGDVMTLKRGHDLPEHSRQEGDVPVVSSSGITGRHKEAKATAPGVVTGRYGTIGEVYFLQEDFWPLNTALYVIDFKGNDPRFTSYFLRNVLKGYQSEKAAIPGVDRNVLHEIKVRLPSLPEQLRITEILSAYDDLIDNNRRRMALLEDSARQLYREWFVRLRFPGYEHTPIVDGVPQGWSKLPASEALEINPKIKLSDADEHWFVEMASLPTDSMVIEGAYWRDGRSGPKFQNGDTLFARITPCLENGKTGFVDFMEGGEVGRALGTAPLVQAIKYDEQGQKINKWVWDDATLSPVELVDAIWRELPDFRESYEVAEGLYRRHVPAYDEKVVRELLVNALVHKPYTQQGDIYLNLHPQRLAVVNPGRLPLGVTPRNLLHASRRRNEGLARVFHDLGLMEREGSGFDLMYDRLLSQGRPAPVAEEGTDWVRVTIERRIAKPEVMRLLTQADERFQLTQRERITLGILAQSEGMTARELKAVLETEGGDDVAVWLGRLPSLALVQTVGRTQGTRYFVDPALLQGAQLFQPTTLARIEPHRLQELIREDLRRYPDSKIGEISLRIGQEVNRSQLKRALTELADQSVVGMTGLRNGARYRLICS